jgi:putative MATE family efflux protein
MKDLTEGHEGKLILQFAMPMLLGNVFQQMYQIIDSIIVGQFLGKQALAAVGASFPIIFTLISLVIGIATGSTIVIAQYFGAKDFDKVKRSIDTLYIYLFVASIILTIVGIIFTEPLFRLMQLPDEIMPQAVTFLQIYLLGMVAFFGFNGTSSILRGLGDSKTPLYFLIASTILNVLLDLLFILVFKWGVAGAAIATVISQTLAFIATIVYLNKYHKIISINIKNLVFDKQLFYKSIKIGLPTGLQQTFVALGMMALMGIVNTFGTNVVAAYSVAARIDSLASMPAMNFSMALSAFVGQNIGANKSNRVRSGLIATLKMSSIIAVSISILVIFAGNFLMKMFTSDPDVIRIGHEYLIIVGMFYLAFNSMFAYNGVMRGAGDTLIPMFITLFSLWLIRIPAAFILSHYFGEIGIWWSIPIAWIIGTCGTYLYYKTGRWKKKVLINQVQTAKNAE